jgi:hypothetical protein
MRHSRKLPAVIAAAIATVSVGAAIASTSSVDDPTGDVSGGNPPGPATKHDVDITRATAGTDGSRVKLTITVDGSINAALSRFETSPGFSFKDRGANHPSYDVYGTTDMGYTAENFIKGDSTPAKLETPTKHKAAITFNPKPIGLSGKYGWMAVTGVCAPLDQAPNHGWASGETAKRC